MGKTRDRMAQNLKLRNFRLSTQQKYLGIAFNFIRYYRRPPVCRQDLGEVLCGRIEECPR